MGELGERVELALEQLSHRRALRGARRRQPLERDHAPSRTFARAIDAGHTPAAEQVQYFVALRDALQLVLVFGLRVD